MQKSGSTAYLINKSTVGNSITAKNFNSNTQRGNYYITTSTTDDSSWNMKVIIFDNNVGGSGGEVQRGYNLDGTMLYVTENGYILPSDDRLSTPTINNNEVLNMDGLISQFYDEGLDMCIYNLKNFNIGDKVIFKDTIHNIEYDADNNCTYFTFNTNFGNVKWKFNGDWTEEYQPGNEIELEFNVQQMCESSGVQFEILDYMQALANDIVPDLNDYLVNN